MTMISIFGMKNIAFTLLILILSNTMLSCSDDDNNSTNKLIFEDLRANVEGPISCQTTNNGFVFEIKLDEGIEISEGSILNTIGITNLPENYKSQGARILISVRQAEFPNGACVAQYSPEYFFENIKVDTIP